MGKQRDFTVLVSRDGGDTWARLPQPVVAGSGDAAIERVRKDPALAADVEAQFFASASFRPKKMCKQVIERWALAFADEAPEEGAG